MPLNGSKIDVAVGGRAGRAEGMRHSVSSDAVSRHSVMRKNSGSMSAPNNDSI